MCIIPVSLSMELHHLFSFKSHGRGIYSDHTQSFKIDWNWGRDGALCISLVASGKTLFPFVLGTNYEIQNIVQEIDRKLKETKTLQESNFIRILEKNTELQNFKSEVEYYINNKSIVEANDKIKDLLSQQR